MFRKTMRSAAVSGCIAMLLTGCGVVDPVAKETLPVETIEAREPDTTSETPSEDPTTQEEIPEADTDPQEDMPEEVAVYVEMQPGSGSVSKPPA